jgi:hypothetical protein
VRDVAHALALVIAAAVGDEAAVAVGKTAAGEEDDNDGTDSASDNDANLGRAEAARVRGASIWWRWSLGRGPTPAESDERRGCGAGLGDRLGQGELAHDKLLRHGCGSWG